MRKVQICFSHQFLVSQATLNEHQTSSAVKGESQTYFKTLFITISFLHVPG